MKLFFAVNPQTGEKLKPAFSEASAADVDRALQAAEAAFSAYGRTTATKRAVFLRAIAEELVAAGEPLIARAHAETALPLNRLNGERIRTVNQLKMFADRLEEGSWAQAVIDTAEPDRKPLPKPDVRRTMVPLGPVVVFAASNFPFAFSVPGGDTASALAAGCPVVCKAHPAHPGTSEMCAMAIDRAAQKTGMPGGVFSLLQGWGHDVGLALARHPLTAAIGFTGSLRGGRAIFDAAASRPAPIPVYAEMGSVNPVFLLPSALSQRADAIADGLAGSITMGVGQFCTNPGVLVGIAGEPLDRLKSLLGERLGTMDAGVMLYDQLSNGYATAIERAESSGASVVAAAQFMKEGQAGPALLATDAARFLADPVLREEMFGPVSMVVAAKDTAELERVAEAIEGQLTASIHGTDEELKAHGRLLEILQRKAGRLVFNQYPTGVEVCHAMHHGGPYPASTDSRTTSVGTAAMDRFLRPVCFQNFPDATLPAALRNANPLGIWRTVNGRLTKDAA